MNVKKKSEFARQPAGDKMILIVGYVILGLFLVAIIFPVIYIILSSFIDPITLQNRGLTFDFSKWTLTAYERVMSNAQIWVGFRNALLYSIASTILSGVITLLAAYPMSRPDFRGRGFFNVVFVITMFFGGGLIPFYNVMSNLGLVNTIWAIVLPSILSVWNLFMTKTFFESSISDGLIEAAKIDGAGPFRIFFSIVIPLSKAILAVMALYYAVGQWNSYFNAMIFLQDETLYPLQLVLKEILIASESTVGGSGETILEQFRLANQLKYVSVIVSSLPVLCLYPFVQKYFAQGVMIGSLKE